MRGSWKLITIKGISVYLHWTFLILVSWIVVSNFMTGAAPTQYMWSLLLIAAVFVCVTLHELGHALVAKKFGIHTKNIILLPIGGVAAIEKIPDKPKQELAISIAGPLVNIVIAALLLLLLPPQAPFWKIREGIITLEGDHFLYNLFIVNLSLALFNLIPAFPMDGGRIFRALLSFKMTYVTATSIAAAVGKVIAFFFIGTGLLSFNPFLALIGLFIIVSARTEEYYLRLKALVKGIKLKELLMHDFNKLEGDMTVGEASSILLNNHNKYFVVMEGATPIGTINRMEIVKAVADMRDQEIISNLTTGNRKFLDGDCEVETVLEKLSGNNERIYPVMENNRFAGVINFQHIIEYLLLNKPHTGEYDRIKSLAGLL
jgi:Zn-dependent protease